MITKGFTFDFSDDVVLDDFFYETDSDSTKLISTCIYVGTAGGIVYENANGNSQWLSNPVVGPNYFSARRILTSATVRGVLRTTTADAMSWGASGRY